MLGREIISASEIKTALTEGLSQVQTILNLTPHDMNREVMFILRKHFDVKKITTDLFTAGVGIFFFTTLVEVQNDFKSNLIPVGMADMFSNVILDELKKIKHVSEFLDQMKKEIKEAKVPA